MAENRMPCIECGEDVTGTTDRAILPYRCAEHREDLRKRWASIFGDSSYNEVGVDVSWSQIKTILGGIERDYARRITFVIISDEQRREWAAGIMNGDDFNNIVCIEK